MILVQESSLDDIKQECKSIKKMQNDILVLLGNFMAKTREEFLAVNEKLDYVLNQQQLDQQQDVFRPNIITNEEQLREQEEKFLYMPQDFHAEYQSIVSVLFRILPPI